MRKVLIIFGSPRKDGNTHILVEQVINGLNDSEIDSEVVYLSDLDINDCQACYFCKRNDNNKCIIDDDMQSVYAKLEDAEGVILASPIYFNNVSGKMRLWLDRMFVYYCIKIKSYFPKGKKVGYVFTQNLPDPDLYTSDIESFKKVVSTLGLEEVGSILATDLDKNFKKMVVTDSEKMKEAYLLGRNFFK